MTKRSGSSSVVSLYDAKTHLSSLVERAAAGEEIVIAKNGSPRARLSALPLAGAERKPTNAMRISYIAEDFDAPDAQIEALFNGDGDAG
jgi:antitoxin (DNA-binding transcriptional repressor) of toxin-antitoxin stability system